MASRLRKDESLKAAFANFDDVATLVGKINKEITDINEKNVKAGGGDEIGKQYHAKIDKPTADLTGLTSQIRDKLKAMSAHGQGTADLFDATDEHNAGLV
ncbi:hypothetical protein [Kitasatospora aureofaciens]|uniref:hypothetical protein n=1 Tax=Kitasatospora aureofaciens TaxID=1894 RepID=UPI001C491C62|nr:hypothetical protein [Kitasatospora aureofaciens]MBV6699316.1 hypothetical protein [Kitasatospora aureofaciens]